MNHPAGWITTPDNAAERDSPFFDRPLEELARWAEKKIRNEDINQRLKQF